MQNNEPVPNSEEYLDPLVYKNFPGTTIKGALPRRLNPNYEPRKKGSRLFMIPLYLWIVFVCYALVILFINYPPGP